MHPLTLLGAVAIAVPLVMTPPASAQPQPATGDPAPAGQHRVTLITGDQVTMTKNPGAEPTFAVEPAPRPGQQRPVRFDARSGDSVAHARDRYVIPSDAHEPIKAGILDKELFNVTGLAREGMDRLDTLPLIVSPGAAPRALVATRSTRALPTIGASAVRVDRADAAGFWESARPALGTAVTRVALDHRRRLSLDVSVPRIGAPQAWRAGHDGTGVTVAVIDSGVDATHPDLADKVVAERNFTEDPDATDGLGHGTHVASTIAGSGAASGVRYRGVAPGAKLVNAKACGADGFCFDSALLPAMDYAARSGAKVINMSLGGGVTDGTDPLSLEVNRLTSQTGALFVIAAGNSGDAGAVTVGAPGAASSALTVGAVDKADGLAAFSSRGPRLGDAAVKPEITAPGVSIAAARATGTALGSPLDDHYTVASGTSMATPHVAGSAAILAGQHPKWTPDRLKGALVSTATPIDATVTETGAGRVDVARASAASLFGSATVDFGRMSGVKVRTVSYTNDGDRPVLLRLTASGTGFNGRPIADGGLRVFPSLVYVPARGKASAHLVANAGRSGTGAFAAMLTATAAGGVSVRTPISLYVTTPTVPLSMTVLDHDGKPTRPNHNRIWIIRDDFDLAGNNDPFAQVWFDPTWRVTTADAQVPAGTYTLLTELYEDGLTRQRTTSINKVDVPVRRATSVTLDARGTVPVSLRTQERTDARYLMHMFGRQLPYAAIAWGYVGFENWPMHVSPTPPARQGSLVYQHAANLAEHLVDLTDAGRQLSARFDPAAVAARWTGEHTVAVVYAGRGSAADFAAVDVRGKIALVGVAVPPDSADPWFDAFVAASAAATEAGKAGATAMMVYADVAGAQPLWNLSDRAIPLIAIGQADGHALRDRAGATLRIHAKAAPSFIYNLTYSKANGVDADQDRVVDRAALTRVDTRYHADVPGLSLSRFWLPFRRGAAAISVVRQTTMPAPAVVAEYVGGGAGAIEEVDWTRWAFLRDGKGNSLGMYQRTAFTPTENWFAGPITPGSSDPRFPSFSRIGFPGERDWLVPPSYIGDSTPGHLLDVNAGRIALTTWALSRDGVPIRPDPSIPSPLAPFFPVPPEPAVYRLDATTVLPPTSTFTPSLAVRAASPRVETSWTFHSPGLATTPCPGNDQLVCATQSLPQLGYDLNVDLTNQARPGPHTIGLRAYRSDSGAPIPATGLTVRYSADEGATWQDARVTGGQAHLTNPERGHVWLRVEAHDEAGNSVTQTVHRAYRIG